MKEVDKNLCDRIRLVREKQGLNKTKTARLTGLRISTISDIETYRIEPSKEVMKKYYEHFGINLHWLFTGEGEMYIKTETENKIKESQDVYKNSNNIALASENKRLTIENERLKKFILRIATKE